MAPNNEHERRRTPLMSVARASTTGLPTQKRVYHTMYATLLTPNTASHHIVLARSKSA
jgi:hypothetical protein